MRRSGGPMVDLDCGDCFKDKKLVDEVVRPSESVKTDGVLDQDIL